MKNIIAALYEKWPSLPYILFGIFYAWLDIMFFSPFVFSGETASSEAIRGTFIWLFFSFCVIANLACVFAHVRIRHFIQKPGSSAFMACCLIVCTLLCYCSASGLCDSGFILIAALFGALGQTCLTLLIVLRFLSLSGFQTFINLALMRIVAAMLYFFISGLPQMIGLIVLALLPIAVAVSSHYSFALDPIATEEDLAKRRQEKHDGEKLEDNSAALARLLIASFALVFVINSMGFGDPAAWPYVETLCVVFALILIVLLVYASSKKNMVLSNWFYFATISVLLAFAVASLLPASESFGFIVCGSFRSVFDAFYLGFLIIIAVRSKHSPVKLTGMFYCCYLSAVLLGTFMVTIVKTHASLTTYGVGASVVALAICAFLLVAFTPKDIQSLLSFSFEQKDAHSEATAVHVHTERSAEALAEKLTEEYALTSREQEVATLLLLGYTVKMISSSLTVSTNTTKTHMRNIYLKAGVKSREELLMLVHKNTATENK